MHGDDTQFYSKARFEGYRRALANYGIAVDPDLLIQVSDTGDMLDALESGYVCGLSLAERRQGESAVFCFTDMYAFGVMRGLREAGLRIPEDFSVVGFDNNAVSGYGTVPLTTVAWPIRTVAQALVEYLLERVENPDQSISPRCEVVKPELIVRKSTAEHVIRE